MSDQRERVLDAAADAAVAVITALASDDTERDELWQTLACDVFLGVLEQLDATTAATFAASFNERLAKAGWQLLRAG